MAIPDFLGSFLCLFTCALSALGSEYYSESMCGVQGFYLVFAFCGNAWTNVVIVHEVNKLLTYSQNRRRYFPPTRQRVFCHVAAVYTYAAVWGVLMAYPFRGLPIQTKLYYGFACFPMEQDTASTWFLYFAFVPGILLIPLLYSMYVMGRIILKGMLPTAGKWRVLSLFLMRLIAVYFLGWLPFLVLCFVGNVTNLGPWAFWVGAAVSHFQGFVSSIVVYKTSENIRLEMQSVFCCDCRGDLLSSEWDEEDDNPENTSSFRFFRRSNRSTSVNQRSSSSRKSQNTNSDKMLLPDSSDSADALRAKETASLPDESSSGRRRIEESAGGPVHGSDEQTDHLVEGGKRQDEEVVDQCDSAPYSPVSKLSN